MPGRETRTVDQHGAVTLPEGLRERFGIQCGDEVDVTEADGRIVIEKAIMRSDLAEGYRRRVDRDERLNSEWHGR